MKFGTVALVINIASEIPQLLETVCDDQEIELLEHAITVGENDPLILIRGHRQKLQKEETEFGDYVEDLLSQPFVRPEIQEHGLQWLRSKMRIEEHQKVEKEATKVIADYAYRIFSSDPSQTDFFLAGPSAQVRIRIFVLPSSGLSKAA